MTQKITIDNLSCLCSSVINKDRIAYILYPLDIFADWIKSAAKIWCDHCGYNRNGLAERVQSVAGTRCAKRRSLFQGSKYVMRTSTNTFIASDTSVCIDYLNVTMTQKIDFPENLFGTCRNAFPASDTFVWIDGNKWRCHTLLQL